MDELKREIKDLIITSLNLQDVTAESIEDGAPLFQTGLGLDSIDALGWRSRSSGSSRSRPR